MGKKLGDKDVIRMRLSERVSDAASNVQEAPPCEVLEEERVFRSVCAAEVAAFDSVLQARRGLEIVWMADKRLFLWENMMGVGHALPMIIRLHALCFSLRRRCHIKLYDTEYDQYFQYANGEGWGPSTSLDVYANVTEWLRFDVPIDHKLQEWRDVVGASAMRRQRPVLSARIIEGRLRALVAPLPHALVRVQAHGWMPPSYGVHRVRPSLPLVTLVQPSTCLARYVTQPRVPPRHREARWPPSIALHLRTGTCLVCIYFILGLRP